MSMDALALLNALDVIRNEGVYQKRLNDLAEAQAKLDTSQYIVETVEVANARLDEANRLLEKHRDMIENFDKQMESERKKKLADIKEQEGLLDQKLEKTASLEKRLLSQLKDVQTDRDAIARTRVQLAASVADYDLRRVEYQTKTQAYELKINKLKAVLEE